MSSNKGKVIRGVGETSLIGIIKGIINYFEDNDLEFVNLNGNELAIKIDGISLTTSKLPFMDFYDMGWKVMASVASDFLVKLSKPMYALVSITLRSSVYLEDFRELVRGLNEGAVHFGMKYLGGDLNEGADNVIDVAALGLVMSNVIGREPRVGDVLITIPKFGYTGLIFRLYYSNELDRWVDLDIVRRGIDMLRRPEPRIDMLNDLLRYGDCISASMDSSDGLGKVLWTMSNDGDVKIIVDKLPTDNDLIESVSTLFNANIEEIVFNGGEEFLPIFAVRNDCVGEFRRLGFEVFGKVEKGKGVYYRDSLLRYRGWDYFIGWSS
ncbi:MAG: thiamine-monophosphate kinase [Vulcanisaeta sp. AZ3]|jgi:thiamine-monophosphate kinase